MAAPLGPCVADELEDALLELIFAAACAGGADASGRPLYRHRAAIPQVCRRWRQVYDESTLLWEEVRLDWGVVLRQPAPPEHSAAAAAARWLTARAPRARRLLLLGCDAAAAAGLPPGAPAGLSSARLREAAFLDASGPFGAELRLLAGCCGLEALAVACPRRPLGPPRPLRLSGEALAELAALPALRSLELLVDKIEGCVAGAAAALPGLTRLAVRCRVEAAVLPPELLEGLSQLRRLELSTVRVAQFTPRLAQALAHLTHLACCDVLAARPRRRAGVQLWEGLRHLPSLRELSLESQGGRGVLLAALACPRLRGLTLVSCGAPDWPLSPARYAGEGGCLGHLRSLHLGSLRLPRGAPPGQLWALAAPGLTSLTWHSLGALPPEDEPPPGEDLAEQIAQLSRAAPVPAELALLRGLRHLSLEYAQLDVVPQAVQALTQLTSLSLEGNRLAGLAAGPYLAGLRHLSLANNAFAEPSDALAACTSLTELDLTANAWLAVDPPAARQLAALPRLQRVRLSASLPSAEACGPAAVGVGSSGGPAGTQLESLRTLVRLLGSRLVLEV